MAALLDAIARASARPRYAFMLLCLIAEVADGNGQAGPFVARGNTLLTLRDWLSEGLLPIGARDPRRKALTERVRDDLARKGKLTANPDEADASIAMEARNRIRSSTKTNLSRAASEMVRAGLLRRHYAGYCVDHHNRGGHRHVVYELIGEARCLLGLTPGQTDVRATHPEMPSPPPASRQGEFAFH